MSSAPGTLGTRVRAALSPNCENLGRSIKRSFLISLVMLSIAFLLIVIILIYNYIYAHSTTTVVHEVGGGSGEAVAGVRTEDTHSEQKRAKMTALLSNAVSIVIALALVVKIWDYNVGVQASNCLSNT